jgi:hypothetical protein
VPRETPHRFGAGQHPGKRGGSGTGGGVLERGEARQRTDDAGRRGDRRKRGRDRVLVRRQRSVPDPIP